MTLQFRSDHSIANHGFHLTWNTSRPVCGETISGQTRGTIMSPGYPGRYPHNADCSWTISVDPGKTIQFHFAMLNIETHQDCGYDRLGEFKVLPQKLHHKRSNFQKSLREASPDM